VSVNKNCVTVAGLWSHKTGTKQAVYTINLIPNILVPLILWHYFGAIRFCTSSFMPEVHYISFMPSIYNLELLPGSVVFLQR